MDMTTNAANRGLYNENAEMSVIGSFLINSRALSHVNEIEESDFFLEDIRTMFRAVHALVSAGKPVDLITLDERVTAQGKNLTERAIDCTRCVASAANVEAYIGIVRELATRRRALEISERLSAALLNQENDTSSSIEDARNALRDIVRCKHTWTEMPELLTSGYDDLSKRCSGAIKPINSGLGDIDRRTGGFFPGEMTIIGARPGVGKSAFGLTIAMNAAKAGLNVCYQSLEMSDVQFWQRIMAANSGVDGMKIRTAKIENNEWGQIAESMNSLSELPISFLFKTDKLEDLKIETQKKADAGRLDMVIVDYVQLMQTRKRFEQERLRVGYISAQLKRMSIELGIPVIVLSQLRRKESGRPVISDLRESGNLEQDADGIILMHRPESADDSAIKKDDRELFETLQKNKLQYITFDIGKQRQGVIGIVPMVFDPARMSYRGIDRGIN